MKNNIRKFKTKIVSRTILNAGKVILLKSCEKYYNSTGNDLNTRKILVLIRDMVKSIILVVLFLISSQKQLQHRQSMIQYIRSSTFCSWSRRVDLCHVESPQSTVQLNEICL